MALGSCEPLVNLLRRSKCNGYQVIFQGVPSLVHEERSSNRCKPALHLSSDPLTTSNLPTRKVERSHGFPA
eukprot:199899-Hanusia_phi.AAC.1